MDNNRETLDFIPFSERSVFDQDVIVRSLAHKLKAPEWMINQICRDLDTRHAYAGTKEKVGLYTHPADQGPFMVQLLSQQAENGIQI